MNTETDIGEEALQLTRDMSLDELALAYVEIRAERDVAARDLATAKMQLIAVEPLYSRRQLEDKLAALENANAMHLANKAMDAVVISAAAARDMRERAAMAVRNKICTISWPPADGDELIDSLMAVIRALPDTSPLTAPEFAEVRHG